jgi:hypothetical protein
MPTKSEVKKPMALRPIVETADSRPGYGHEDSIAKNLNACRATIAEMAGAEDDPYADALAAACTAAANGLERVRRAHWQWSDDLNALQCAQSGFTAARKQQAAAAVQTTGNYSPVELDRKIAGAMNGIEEEIRTMAIAQVLTDPVKKEAMQLATTAADALRELDVAVVSAKEDWTGPPQLRGQDNSLESIWAVSSLQTELKVLEPKKLHQMFVGFVQRGEDEKAKSFMRAARSILVDLKTKPNPVLANMFRVGGNGGRDDQATEHRSYVFKLIDAFDAYQAERTPKSIYTAETIYVALRELFFVLAGIHASSLYMTDEVFRREFLDGTSGLAALERDPLRVDENYPSRFLVGGKASLPGWSVPIATTSTTGVKVRKPRGA